MMGAGFVTALLGVTLLVICAAAIFYLRKRKETWHRDSISELTASKLNRSDTDRLMAFLEEADNAYIKAYQYRSLGELIQFITREMAIEMQQKITYYNDKIWGTPAHRQRSWSVVSINEETIIVRKELTFKRVKYGRMLVKLGDDTIEYWKVIYDNLDKNYKIQEITC